MRGGGQGIGAGNSIRLPLVAYANSLENNLVASHLLEQELNLAIMQNDVTDRSSLVDYADKPAKSTVKAGDIDATVKIVTPENISFDYRVAGPTRRLLAFIIDFLVRMILMIVLYVLLSLLFLLLAQFAALAGFVDMVRGSEALRNAIYLTLYFLITTFYGGLFETYWNGRTPGKWLLGIRVLSANGEPVNGMQAILRNILRMVEFFPFVSPQIFELTGDEGIAAVMIIPTYMLGLVVMSCNRKSQRLGDLVCNTVVVMEERSWLMGVAKLEDQRTSQLAAYLPPKFQVSRSMARALATYVERRRYFSQARRREIARHLGEPLLREFELPADTSYDLLLCALYYRTFIADKGESELAIPDESPFAQPQSAVDFPGINVNPQPLPQEQMFTIGPPGHHR